MVDYKHVSKILTDNFQISDNSTHAASWTLDNDQKVTVYGDVRLLTNQSKLPLQFSKVMGDFELFNRGLRSLEGAPSYVAGNFGAAACQLQTLKHAPQTVKGYFNVASNQIENLDGFPTEVGDSVFLAYNNLDTLEGLPDVLYHDLKINCNTSLSSLKGLPRKIIGWLTLDYTPTMPLLRTLAAMHVNLHVNYKDGGRDTKMQLSRILNDQRWIGKGMMGMFDCKKELIEAGFVENARW